MKKYIVGFICGALLAGGTAGAAASWVRTGSGYRCETGSGGIVCVPITAEGFGVGMHKDFIFVQNVNTERRVFFRFQP